MNKKLLILAILAIFIVGMVCAFACEPVEAKHVAKIKKVKKYYKAKFNYKGHKYKAKLKKNKKMTKYYGDKTYDSTKKKGGHTFRLYYASTPDEYGHTGWNFCKLRNSAFESHIYYKIKWV